MIITTRYTEYRITLTTAPRLGLSKKLKIGKKNTMDINKSKHFKVLLHVFNFFLGFITIKSKQSHIVY